VTCFARVKLYLNEENSEHAVLQDRGIAVEKQKTKDSYLQIKGG
jgi:hypothetical protein